MFKDDDIRLCKGMVHMWNNAQFNVKPHESESFVLVCRWVKSLEEKVAESVDKKPAPKPQGITKGKK